MSNRRSDFDPKERNRRDSTLRISVVVVVSGLRSQEGPQYVTYTHTRLCTREHMCTHTYTHTSPGFSEREVSDPVRMRRYVPRPCD